jgi:hypothetical protein
LHDEVNDPLQQQHHHHCQRPIPQAPDFKKVRRYLRTAWDDPDNPEHSAETRAAVETLRVDAWSHTTTNIDRHGEGLTLRYLSAF